MEGQRHHSVLLVDGMTLTRECLAHTLGAVSPDFAVRGVGTCAEAIAAGLPRPDVAILSLASPHEAPERWVAEQVAQLEQEWPDTPLIALSQRDDAATALQALRSRFRGYIPTSLSIRVLVAAMRLVVAGGTFVPTVLVADYGRFALIPEPSATPSARQPTREMYRLTGREKEVLKRIELGRPNKIIAHELAIAESTVKVHVRNIMKKVRASNRTEAAFLASRLRDDEPELVANGGPSKQRSDARAGRGGEDAPA